MTTLIQIDNVNDTAGREKLLDESGKFHDPPRGFNLTSEDERVFWEILMGTRAYKAWTPADLILAFRVVKLEMQIRKGFERLDQLIEHGADPFDEDSVANSYNKQLMMAQKNQILMLRALGFTRGILPNDQAASKRAILEQEMKAKMTGGALGLPAFMASR